MGLELGRREPQARLAVAVRALVAPTVATPLDTARHPATVSRDRLAVATTGRVRHGGRRRVALVRRDRASRATTIVPVVRVRVHLPAGAAILVRTRASIARSASHTRAPSIGLIRRSASRIPATGRGLPATVVLRAIVLRAIVPVVLLLVVLLLVVLLAIVRIASGGPIVTAVRRVVGPIEAVAPPVGARSADQTAFLRGAWANR